MSKVGAPEWVYDPVLGDEICSLMVELETTSIKNILASDERFPHYITLQKWLRNNPEFAAQYSRAIADRHHALVEGMIEIADDDGLSPDARRVRIDTRKWIASKILPKQYGDKVTTEVTGPDGKAIQHEVHQIEWRVIEPPAKKVELIEN